MSVQPAATHKMIITVYDGHHPFDRQIVQTGFDLRQHIRLLITKPVGPRGSGLDQ